MPQHVERATTRSRAAALMTTIVSLTIIAMAGCEAEPTRVRVAGQVRLDGTPLKAGEVLFVPANGRPASASIGSDGRFKLTSETVADPARKGVVPGSYKVAVTTISIVDGETATWTAPQKYASHLTSGIEVVIDQPTDSLMIELSSEAEDGAEIQPAGNNDGSDPQ